MSSSDILHVRHLPSTRTAGYLLCLHIVLLALLLTFFALLLAFSRTDNGPIDHKDPNEFAVAAAADSGHPAGDSDEGE